MRKRCSYGTCNSDSRYKNGGVLLARWGAKRQPPQHLIYHSSIHVSICLLIYLFIYFIITYLFHVSIITYLFNYLYIRKFVAVLLPEGTLRVVFRQVFRGEVAFLPHFLFSFYVYVKVCAQCVRTQTSNNAGKGLYTITKRYSVPQVTEIVYYVYK